MTPCADLMHAKRLILFSGVWMKSYILKFLFCCFFLLPVSQAVDLSGFPPCNVPACSSVAKLQAWPVDDVTTDDGNIQRVSFHGFHVLLSHVAVISRPNYRQFNFDENRRVSLSVFTREDMDEFFKASQYDMTDWANIVFTQTPKKKAPESPAEAYAWYSALMTKVVFVGNAEVYQFNKKPFSVYWVKGKRNDNSVLMVVSDKLPNTLLKIEAIGLDRSDVMRLIAGLSS